jgi:hypothetical protein
MQTEIDFLTLATLYMTGRRGKERRDSWLRLEHELRAKAGDEAKIQVKISHQAYWRKIGSANTTRKQLFSIPML